MQPHARLLSSEQPAATPFLLERPFYFIVVLWGQRFRNYFLDLCLPTLLSAHNLPSLSTKSRSKFLICTRPQDWAAMRAAPIFQLLEQYVDPVYLEIPPCPVGTPGAVHMGAGHRPSCELAYAAKAYPLVLMPDWIFSDGTIARLQELALQGVELVLVPSLRFAEEPLFQRLREAGISPCGRDGIAAPITLNGRQLVRMALTSLHSETKSYEWDVPYFHPIPSAAWWRVPDEDGIVVHCFCWHPLLIDYAAVPEHDTSTFDNWTVDGDYTYKNLGNIQRVHLVQDSDEIFIASWSPLSDGPCDLSPQRLLASRLVGGLVKRHQLSTAFYHGFSDPSKENPLLFDPLKQTIFFDAARWHTTPIGEAWTRIERRALRTLHSCVAPSTDEKIALLRQTSGPPFQPRRKSHIELCTYFVLSRFIRRLFQLVCTISLITLRATEIIQHFWIHREALLPRLRQVLQGDRDVIRWLRWRMRELAYHLGGRTLRHGKPPRPSR
jgi:hypothetical protein